MLQQSAEANHITDIIKVMNSGIQFYQKAKEKVDSQPYQSFFNRMIDAKAEAVFELQQFAVEEKGDLENGTDVIVKAREAYTEVVDKMTSNSTEFTYVDQLEEVEDRLLEEVDQALSKEQSLECEAALVRVQKRMKECHDEMRALQNGIVH
ncbi:hypothetical protein DN730_06555 [Marinomonas piezotolerans]|uniref:DUF2383 domain-containing protein n=1 Tax=Marinomonas piezotolerans TaxID=2213058 RepID=A0A370UBT5_9GAMM|nr:PA2169 family four-helix-bundle protein [Marinomonas piezotolerans]RDL45267.1 hypothetical protein DN730_06555 [Marinomonas piezotolerans]